jgi:hypothetical protein
MSEPGLDRDRQRRITEEAMRRGRRIRLRRRVTVAGVAATLAILAILLVSAVSLRSSGSGQTTVAAPATSGEPSTQGPQTTARPTTLSPRTTVTAASPTPCTTEQLSARFGPAQGTFGSEVIAARITNTSRATCAIVGYPSLRFQTAGGQPLSVSSLPISPQGCSCHLGYVSSQPFALAPGQAATFGLTYVDSPAGNQPAVCPTAATAIITLPGQPGHLIVKGSFASICSSVYVQALYRGDLEFGPG